MDTTPTPDPGLPKTSELPPPTVRIGLVGGRGTGKTSFLASLLSINAPRSGGHVTLYDGETRATIRRWWELLQQGDVPPATAAKDHFPDLRFRVAADGAEWNVVVHDYAGRLLELMDETRASAAEPGPAPGDGEIAEALREKVGKLLGACDAALFFLPVDLREERGSVEGRAYQLALTAAMEYFRAENGAARRTRPFCLALSKWDLVSDRCAAPLDYLEREPDLAHCAAIVRAGGAAFTVLPLSAYGHHDEHNPRKPKADHVEPLNVFESLHWLCRETSGARYARAQTELAAARPRFGLCVPHGRRARIYAEALDGVAEPERRAELSLGLDRARRGRSRARVRRVVLLALLAAVAAAGWSWRECARNLRRYPADPEMLLGMDWPAAAARLDNPWVRYPAAWGLPWAVRLERCHAERFEAFLRELGRRAEVPADDPDAPDEQRKVWSSLRTERLNAALAHAPEGSEQRREWSTRRTRETALRAELSADDAFRRDYDALILGAADDGADGLAKRIDAFLAKYPVAEHPRKHKEYAVLRDRRQAQARAVDEAEAAALLEWADARTLPPAQRVDFAGRRMAIRERYAERRLAEGLPPGDGPARLEAERQLVAHWTPYIALDASLETLDRTDATALTAFLAENTPAKFPERADELAQLADLLAELENRRSAAKAGAALATATAYWADHPNAYRNALDRFAEVRDLAAQAPNGGGDTLKTAVARLAEVRAAWRRTAHDAARAATERLRPETVAAAADACAAFMALPDEVRGDDAVASAWASYLKALAGRSRIAVELASVDLEGSPFSRWVRDCRVAVTLEQDGRVARFAGEAPGTRAGPGVTFSGEDAGHFALAKNKVTLSGWSKTLEVSPTGKIKVGLSEGDSRGTTYLALFDALLAAPPGTTRIERTATIYQDGTDADPARIGLAFSGFPPRPEPWP